jgi:cyanate permease
VTNVHSQTIAASAATNDLRDIKPPIEIPNAWVWAMWGVLALAVAALAFWTWRYWRKRRSQVPPVLVIPAHIRAKQKLREALALIGQPREFCILVSVGIWKSASISVPPSAQRRSSSMSCRRPTC